ncbi:putative sulfate exporter family transporter [Magnetofaba australis]|uniref:Sulfate exporter family transporter n=1 Tax=Magnetofaba australis IT-1 TaxID=1434232 RepID=W0LMY1_9PROT|nr:putative sulfate exporter family transporter [Magnetofaba australis]AHG23904.1 hypothetical protein MIIT1_02813 [Magnetofaba australis IT-1]OSM08651.1 hypothetical protein MAIT1_02813 [Magnetofaba australis IT-1]
MKGLGESAVNTLLIAIATLITGIGLLVAWWWSVGETLRGALPLMALGMGWLALSSGLARLRRSHQGEREGAVLITEDWWAVWLGMTVVLVALGSFFGGAQLIHDLSVNPGGLKWASLDQLSAHFQQNQTQYLAQFLTFATLFGFSCHAMGIPLGQFLRGFTALYGLSLAIFAVSGWEHAAQFNLEAPLVALVVGLILANTIKLPEWLMSAMRVEYYVKFGIVLLGATFPVSLIVSAGGVAIVQATIIAVVTCLTIYYLATRVFALDRRFAAVLSVGGSVCGVSGSMAIAAAVGARKEHIYATISLVVVWALVMIIALPIAAQALNLHPGVAGAWIGASEFADAAGFAAASAVGKMAGNEEPAIKAFTLMKVIGRDIWIGLWSLVWAYVAVTVWQGGQQPGAALDRGEIWRRFPKFVLGFFAASILVTLSTLGFDDKGLANEVKPHLLQPLGALRGWAFIFCFLSIGLNTRFRELSQVGGGAVAAFSLGVAVNVLLGYLFSVHIFGDYWAQL